MITIYNRYIPQPDGSYRRRRVADPPSYHQATVEPLEEHPESDCREQAKPETDCAPPKPTPCQRSRQHSQRPISGQQRSQRQQREQPCRENRPERSDNQLHSFFRNLLPKDFDTTDLLIVLLLLLMAGDCQEEQNSALLTLALYFFM